MNARMHVDRRAPLKRLHSVTYTASHTYAVQIIERTNVDSVSSALTTKSRSTPALTQLPAVINARSVDVITTSISC